LVGSSSQQKEPTGAWQVVVVDEEGLLGEAGPLGEDASQLTVYDVTPLTLDMAHCHVENELVHPERAWLHKSV
jgi:hypothetical protein